MLLKLGISNEALFKLLDENGYKYAYIHEKDRYRKLSDILEEQL